ncbi:MAG: BMP family ABC transporter substrate-binding protein [Dethiosulfovibrio peptidovorans]|nr:MAG: BMP family ABC transporter substrate-binding protein [Dethiosulfovibrio peptidovorans]
MRHKLGAVSLAIGLILAATLAAWAGDKKPGDYKIVLILPGPINDQSWNATNYAGLTACNKTLGTAMEYVENVQPSDYESTFRNYAERGYDLIMAAGTQFDETANRVAAKYPKSVFCVVNGMVSGGPNVRPVLPKEYEASYLAGIIAGFTTKSGKIGMVGGFPNKLMVRLMNTYEYGVRIGAPRVEANRAYANSWSDVALGKQMASAMIDKGADVLFFYANQVGLGAIQAAREKGAKFVGFASNQNDIAKGTVVASVYFDFSAMYTWALKKFMAGELAPEVNGAGVAEGIVKVAFTDQVSKEVQEYVHQAEKAIASGTVLYFASQFPESLK